MSAAYSVAGDPPKPPESLLAPVIQIAPNPGGIIAGFSRVTLSNPNPAGSSTLWYALAPIGGSYPPVSSWSLYTTTFNVSDASYPNGFQVKAFAKSLDPATYTDSGFAEQRKAADFFGIPIVGDILFVLDASSSMNKDFGDVSRYEAVINETVRSIRNLPPNLKFSVAMFDDGEHWTDGSWQLKQATTANKNTMIELITKVKNDEGTNYAAGLGFAPKFAPNPIQVIFLSDGRPSGSYSSQLNKLVQLKIRVDTVGVDTANDQSATDKLKAIAAATNGTFTELRP